MKKTILLIHGLRGDHHGLAALAEELEQKGYAVINPDLPGSGDNAELDEKTLDGYADWLHKNYGDKNYYIAAHSMGSIIVSHYLAKYPEDKVQRRVILISPIFRTKAGQKTSNLFYALVNGALHILPKKPRYNFMRSKSVSFCTSHYLTSDKKQQKNIDQLHYKYSGHFASADSLLADMKISMKEQTILPENKDVLYIIGDKDRLTKAKFARAKAEEQSASFTELAGTGHLVNYEQPAELAKAIDDFIRA
jgi:alpha-beta hydrolase superfamily lysophospholipase